MLLCECLYLSTFLLAVPEYSHIPTSLPTLDIIKLSFSWYGYEMIFYCSNAHFFPMSLNFSYVRWPFRLPLNYINLAQFSVGIYMFSFLIFSV